jgi:hypothetical protein
MDPGDLDIGRKNLTQSRLRPISPFSYVGQGRKGAKKRRIATNKDLSKQKIPTGAPTFA